MFVQVVSSDLFNSEPFVVKPKRVLRKDCFATIKVKATISYNENIVSTISTGGGDSSVVRAPDSLLKGRGFESLLERRENFLLQGRLSVLTLISVSVPPPCYRSST